MNGTDAWATFQASQFDLCLLDIMLPQSDSFTLVQKIRAVNDTYQFCF
ncbi:hypothetical protein [Spirosoma fluminis]